VQPYFYETLFAKILLMIFAVAAGAFTFYIRARIERKRRLELEQTVTQRTGELQHVNAQLTSANSSLEVYMEELEERNKLNERLTYILSHDLQSPLKFLVTICESIESAALIQDNDAMSRYASAVKNESLKIHTLATELLVWMKHSNLHAELVIENLAVKSIMTEVYAFYSAIAQHNNNTIDIDCADHAAVWADKRILKIILRNLVDNANKNTRKGHITMGCYSEDDQTIIYVSDTGRGMNNNQLGYIKDLIHDKVSIKSQNMKLGYSIITSFVKLSHWKIEVESEEKVGTKVWLAIPHGINKPDIQADQDLINP
jgi:signal transduction histidine kinase